jgi:transposase
MMHIRIQGTAVNSEHFIDYLKALRQKMGRKPLAILFDQLAVHRSKDVKPFFEKLNIKPVFNVSYSPEFNAIEAAFSKVKFLFNHKRLNCLVNKLGFNSDREIEQAFKAITAEHCGRCVRKSMFLLEREA